MTLHAVKKENKSKCLRHWGIYWRVFLQAGWCNQWASDVIRDLVYFSSFSPLYEFHPKATFPHGDQMAAEVPDISSSHRRRDKYDISSSLWRMRPAFSENVKKPLFTFP